MIRSAAVWRCCLLAGLSFCLALAGGTATTAQAQEKPKVQAEDKAPLDPRDFRISASKEQLATLVIGLGATPSVGSLQTATVLAAGEKVPFVVWEFQQPPELPPAIHGASMLFLSGAQARIGSPAVVLPQINTPLWFYMGDTLKYFSLMDTSKVQKVPPFLLMFPQDEQPVPDLDSAASELETYGAMLRFAWHTGVNVFLREARRDVGYGHLMAMPKRYRGEVIFVKGRMRMLEKWPAPLELRLLGVSDIYRGWVFANNSTANPVCILFTELPQGIALGEKINVEVGFAGYFFKKLRYTAFDQRGINKQQRDAPVLIGRMPSVIQASPPAEDSMDRKILYGLLGLVGVTLFGVLGLTLWFRFHDMKVRQRLEQATRKEFVLPPPDVEEKYQPSQVTNVSPETTENWNGSSTPTPAEEPGANHGAHNRLSELPPS